VTESKTELQECVGKGKLVALSTAQLACCKHS